MRVKYADLEADVLLFFFMTYGHGRFLIIAGGKKRRVVRGLSYHETEQAALYGGLCESNCCRDTTPPGQAAKW